MKPPTPCPRRAFDRLLLHCTIVCDAPRTSKSFFVDPDLRESGWQFFAARPDKEWSLTDCLSMLVCQRLNITDILTSDHHFTQAGFKRLLTPA